MNKKNITKGLGVGVLVFVLGFGLLWRMYACLGGSPGLFDFKAATWGDSLCLPSIACLFTFFLLNNKKRGSKHNTPQVFYTLNGKPVLATISQNGSLLKEEKTRRIIPQVFFILGASAGVIIQAEWLWSKNTTPNWSIPQTHFFNIAGWWHSIFFSCILGLFSYFLASGFFVIKDKEHPDLTDKILWGGILFFGGLFLFLQLYDYCLSGIIEHSSGILRHFFNHHALLYSTSFAGIAVAFFLYFNFSRLDKGMFKSALIGLLVALAAAILICETNIKGDRLVAIGCAVVASAGWKTRKMKTTIPILLISLIPYYIIFYYISSLNVLMEILCMLGLVSALSIAFDLLQKKNQRLFFPAIIAMSFLVIYIKLPSSQRDKLYFMIEPLLNIPFKQVILYLIIFAGFGLSIKNIFAAVIDCEKEINKEIKINSESSVQVQMLRRKLTERKKVCYPKIVVIIIGLSALFVCWFKELSIHPQDFKSKYENLPYLPYQNAKTLGFVLVFITIVSILARIQKKRFISLAIFFTALLGLAIIWINAHFIINHRIESHIQPKIFILLLAFIFIQCLGTAFSISDGFYRNTTIIRGNSPSRFTYIVSALLFMISFLGYTANVIIVMYCLSKAGLVMIIINLLIVSVALPCMCVDFSKPTENNHTQKVILNSARGGVLQDGFSATVAQLFLVFLPYFYIMICGVDNNQTWVSLVVIMTLGMFVVGYFMKNNLIFVINQKSNVTQEPGCLIDWFAVRNRIIWQQCITLVMAFPYSAFKVIVTTGMLIFRLLNSVPSKEWLHIIKDDFISTYIDKSSFEKDFAVLRYVNGVLQEKGNIVWTDTQKAAFKPFIEAAIKFSDPQYGKIITNHEEEINIKDSENNPIYAPNFTTNQATISIIPGPQPSVRLYIRNLSEGASALLNNQKVISKKSDDEDGRCYFEFTDIAPEQLNERIAVCYKGVEYTFSPLSWAYCVINTKDAYQNQDDIMKANTLFEYFSNAIAFVNA